MKQLSQIAAKPQLIEVVLDDEQTIAEHGESIQFWTWDRQPLPMFMKLASLSGADTSAMIEVVRTLILDQAGREIITEAAMLPTPVLLRAIARITDLLGK
jgi:hypothetical protein